MITLKISGRKRDYVDLIQKAAECAYAALNLSGSLNVELDFVSSGSIRELNDQHRNIDKVTDVLSFPFLELKAFAYPHGYPRFDEKSFPFDINENNEVSLGSIVICSAKAKKQALEYGHSVEREVAYLFVHGLLHLLGFDHMGDGDKAKMRLMEEKIMSAINLARQE